MGKRIVLREAYTHSKPYGISSIHLAAIRERLGHPFSRRYPGKDPFGISI